MHACTYTHTFPSCEVCVYEGGLEDGKTGNYGVRVVEDVCQQTQRVQVLVHITPIIKGKRGNACLLRLLTPLVAIFAVVGGGAARDKR